MRTKDAIEKLAQLSKPVPLHLTIPDYPVLPDRTRREALYCRTVELMLDIASTLNIPIKALYFDEPCRFQKDDNGVFRLVIQKNLLREIGIDITPDNNVNVLLCSREHIIRMRCALKETEAKWHAKECAWYAELPVEVTEKIDTLEDLLGKI